MGGCNRHSSKSSGEGALLATSPEEAPKMFLTDLFPFLCLHQARLVETKVFRFLQPVPARFGRHFGDSLKYKVIIHFLHAEEVLDVDSAPACPLNFYSLFLIKQHCRKSDRYFKLLS